MLYQKIDLIQFISRFRVKPITNEQAIRLSKRFSLAQLERIASRSMFRDLKRAIAQSGVKVCPTSEVSNG